MIALLCNLSLFIPLIVLLFYLVIISIIQIRQFSRKQLAGFWITTLCFLTFLIPVYIYILKLKKTGALWWGSSSGLWEVNGKSISKNVLFTDHDTWKFILLAVLALIGITFLLLWRKTGFVSFLQKTEFWIPALFGITLISFILLAGFMDVNYPMDRVGMYLVPLFILTFGLLMEKYPFTKWSLLLLLWFPFSFVFKMNLNTSVFSPQDRIHKAFYQKIILEVPDSASISADYVSQAGYAYLTRKEKIPHIAADYLPEDSLSKGDYHISWIEKLKWPDYSCLLYDPISGTRLYKRTIPFKTQVILDTLLYPKKSKGSVIPLMAFDVRSFANQIIQTSVEGNVQLGKYCLDLNLRHEIQSRKGQIRRTDNTRFNWYFGRKTAYLFRYPNHRIAVMPDDRFLLIRFYNDDLNEINLDAIRVKIVVVTEKFK
jgi:hypothetical protein